MGAMETRDARWVFLHVEVTGRRAPVGFFPAKSKPINEKTTIEGGSDF